MTIDVKIHCVALRPDVRPRLNGPPLGSGRVGYVGVGPQGPPSNANRKGYPKPGRIHSIDRVVDSISEGRGKLDREPQSPLLFHGSKSATPVSRT